MVGTYLWCPDDQRYELVSEFTLPGGLDHLSPIHTREAVN